VATELAASKSDARRLLQQGSVRANGVVLAADRGLDPTGLVQGRFLLLRKGKRHYHLAEILDGEVDAPEGGR
jgi:tyrosyl-tRNA synthetase